MLPWTPPLLAVVFFVERGNEMVEKPPVTKLGPDNWGLKPADKQRLFENLEATIASVTNEEPPFFPSRNHDLMEDTMVETPASRVQLPMRTVTPWVDNPQQQPPSPKKSAQVSVAEWLLDMSFTDFKNICVGIAAIAVEYGKPPVMYLDYVEILHNWAIRAEAGEEIRPKVETREPSLKTEDS